jgi:hypothetical protein
VTSSLISPTNSTAGSTLGLPDIAFVGKAGAGKSTAADLLCELGYKKLSFAAPLKDIAAQLWGFDARTDRRKLQCLGVAVREIEPDTWVDLLIATRRGDPRELMQHPPPGAPPCVVDDARFENEWYGLKAEGFTIVRIAAPRAFRIDRLKSNGKWQDEEQLEHSSEIAVDHLKADYTIRNDGPQTDLYDELVEVVLRERKRR